MFWGHCSLQRYFRNRKHFPSFNRVMVTRVEVWKIEKCCGIFFTVMIQIWEYILPRRKCSWQQVLSTQFGVAEEIIITERFASSFVYWKRLSLLFFPITLITRDHFRYRLLEREMVWEHRLIGEGFHERFPNLITAQRDFFSRNSLKKITNSGD